MKVLKMVVRISIKFQLIAVLTLCVIPQASMGATSLTLREATAKALAQSEDVKRVSELLSAARAQIFTSYTTFLPTLEAKLATGTTRAYEGTSTTASSPQTYEQVDRNKYTGALVFTQPIFSGFSSLSALGSAKSNVTMQETNLNLAKSSVLLETTKIYLRIQLHLEEIEAEKEVKALRANRFQEANVQVRQGRATRLDLLQAEYALKSQDPVILKLEGSLESARLKLKRLIGLPIDQSLELKDSLIAVFKSLNQIKLPALDQAYRSSMEQNFELRAKTFELKKLEHELDSKTNKHWPTLNFVMTAAVDAKLREEISTEKSRSYSGELQLNVPLFSGLSSVSERREKVSTIASRQHEIAQRTDQLFVDLSELYRKLNENRAEIDASEVNLKLADESIKSSESLYAVGKATMTEVLDSYARKVQARRGLANALFERVVTTFEIQHMIGLMPEEKS